MTITPDEWDTDLESVEQVAARDTIPAPPPTEPNNERPVVVSSPRPLEPGDHTCGGYGKVPCLACAAGGDQCSYCGELFEHDPACPLATVIS